MVRLDRVLKAIGSAITPIALLIDVPSGRHRIGCSEVGKFFDVVDQAVEHPLDVHLQPPAKREAVEPFLYPEVGEHRFHNRQPFALHLPAERGVDLGSHRVGDAARTLAVEDMDLAGWTVRVAQAFQT